MVSVVKFINRDLAQVAGEGATVLVGRAGTTVLVVSYDGKEVDTGRPIILLSKEEKSVDDAVKKQLYLVGKMCRKEKDSKYFAGQMSFKNMSNGDFTKHRKMDYIRWATEMQEAAYKENGKS